jgi:hypothetical protein
MLCSSFSKVSSGQSVQRTDTTAVTVIAGPQYDRSVVHKWLWGRNFRKIWLQPVRVPVLRLDTASGGLTPYQAGGGLQKENLRLRTADKKEYVLRGVDKAYGKTLPPIYQNTFIESLANDHVSMGHPYASVTIPPMASAAGIYHTQPQIRFVPKQPALDSFNEAYGNKLYLLEQRPDENWEEADNLGNSKNIVGTERLQERLLEGNNSLVDQEMYVRARLFDMFVGDWGRHEDQWRWASADSNGVTIYQPIPRDRDQVYSRINGKLTLFLRGAVGLRHLQNFEGKVKNIKTYNFPARNLDRRMTNGVSLASWLAHAKELQEALTDEVIDNAIKQLPPEVYPMSGPEIAAKLKSRRGFLVKYATDYYKFLAAEVDIPATAGDELFVVDHLGEKETRVSVFRIGKDGNTEPTPFYQRLFNKDETKEVRIYGIGGNDRFEVKGSADNTLTVRIVGGRDKDVVTDSSGSNRIYVYDNADNIFNGSGKTHFRVSSSDSIHNYKYDAFRYRKEGLRPSFFYSNPDRFYFGLNHKLTLYKWRREPFRYQHRIYLRHSITQQAPSAGYIGVVNGFIGKWGLLMNIDYDGVRWLNYYGIGNETERVTKDRNFYRMRYREVYAGVGLTRTLGQRSNITVTPYYQGIRVLRDDERFLAKTTSSDVFTRYHYGGIAARYNLNLVDNMVLPRKGMQFTATASHTRNLSFSEQEVTKVGGALSFYIPVSPFVLAITTGASTLEGQPKFFQLNYIGGTFGLRGYRRERFFGHTTFYVNNELQYLFNVRSRVFNGTAGIFGLYDLGRVWQPGEQSDMWHYGAGGGLILSPFDLTTIAVSFAVSREDKMFHIRLNRPI